MIIMMMIIIRVIGKVGGVKQIQKTPKEFSLLAFDSNSFVATKTTLIHHIMISLPPTYAVESVFVFINTLTALPFKCMIKPDSNTKLLVWIAVHSWRYSCQWVGN